MAGRFGRRLPDSSGFSGDSPASYRGRMWKEVNHGKNANRKVADASHVLFLGFFNQLAE